MHMSGFHCGIGQIIVGVIEKVVHSELSAVLLFFGALQGGPSFRDGILKIERDLSNSMYNTSISGVKFSWTTLYTANMR